MTPYDLAYSYALYTHRSIFLTGKAGTGKTTLLKRLTRECRKHIIVCAPTGVAAINAEGVTIHSLFQLPPQLFLPTPAARKQLFGEIQMRDAKRRLLRNLELLVIDEVSMVRADLLDAIDAILRHVRRNDSPFGGVQVLLIGDLYQLSPVARPEEWSILEPYYQGAYFFQSHVYEQVQPVYIELDTIFRQQNQDFIALLNQVRENRLTPDSLALLNSRCTPEPEADAPFHITLATHNRQVDTINQAALEQLAGPAFTFHAAIKGDFPETLYPIDEALTLKRGARVMFIKTDSSQAKAYYNGKLAIVSRLSADLIEVRCDDGETIQVHSETWENVRYHSKPGQATIETEVIGEFTHLPLRLAWAVTIHKAQGLSFDYVNIDAAEAFAAGQVYVALSRCRTLEGIRLLSPIPRRALNNAAEVVRYTTSQPGSEVIEQSLPAEEDRYLCMLLCELYDFGFLQHQIDLLRRQIADGDYLLREPKWPDGLYEQMTSWQVTALQFQTQLQHIFAAPEIDWPFLTQRLQSAARYYKPLFDQAKAYLMQSPVQAEQREAGLSYEAQWKDLYAALGRQDYMMQHIIEHPSIRAYFETRAAYSLPAVKFVQGRPVLGKSSKTASAAPAKKEKSTAPRKRKPATLNQVLEAYKPRRGQTMVDYMADMVADGLIRLQEVPTFLREEVKMALLARKR